MSGRILAAAVCAALALPCAARAELVGHVVRVIDGDTVAVRVQEHVVNVHLRRIDAPEIGQPYGRDALEALSRLCDSKPATLDQLGVDRDRRIVGEIDCAGIDAQEAQVRFGLAWVLDARASSLQRLQREARAERRGLWNDDAPVAPWDWSHAPTR